jgi:hypothetical protein
MEVDSKEEKKELSLPEKCSSKCTIDINNSDNCSIKSDVCDSDPQTKKSQISHSIKEDVENERIKDTNSDRKRAADDDDSLSSLPKRSRLDDVIGKLGSQIGIPLDKVRTMDELSDTDATDASHLDSEMTESKSEETSSDTDEKPYICVSINPENIRFCHFTNGGHTRKSIMAAPMFLRMKRSIYTCIWTSIFYLENCLQETKHKIISFGINTIHKW